MINIVIPMAGRGSRFADAGYVDPKPLIDVEGKPMIARVVENIRPSQEHKFIFICQQEHIQKYKLDCMLKQMEACCEIVTVDHITEGAACTVLLAEKYIDNQDELMIANSDQYVEVEIDEYLKNIGLNDGLIMTMPATESKWSYIKYNDEGYVTLVKEKEVISDQATVGIYNFIQGSDFVKYAHQMIDKEIRVNGEYYVAPVYNEMIEEGKKIVYHDIGNKMHGLGTPEDLEMFLQKRVLL